MRFQIARGKGTKAMRPEDMWRKWKSGEEPPAGLLEKGAACSRKAQQKLPWCDDIRLFPSNNTAKNDAGSCDAHPCIWKWSLARRKQAIHDWMRELEEAKKEQLEEDGQDLWDLMQALEKVRCLT